MKKISEYNIEFKSENLTVKVKEFLDYYNKEDTFVHSLNVAKEAKSLAARFNNSEEKAFIAGLLHDIAVVIPNEERVGLQRSLNLELLDEEVQLPMILHQKQAVLISEEIFDIHDKEILSAMESHTTLRKNASDLDKIVFIADKLRWDGNDRAPYQDELEVAVNKSLDEACRTFTAWAINGIVIVHPWLKDAMEDLRNDKI